MAWMDRWGVVYCLLLLIEYLQTLEAEDVCIFPALHRGVRFSVLRVRREEYISPRFALSDGSCGVEI